MDIIDLADSVIPFGNCRGIQGALKEVLPPVPHQLRQHTQPRRCRGEHKPSPSLTRNPIQEI